MYVSINSYYKSIKKITIIEQTIVNVRYIVFILSTIVDFIQNIIDIEKLQNNRLLKSKIRLAFVSTSRPLYNLRRCPNSTFYTSF